MTPSADASAGFLADLVASKSDFLFLRYGDGAIECMKQATTGRIAGGGQTCDGEAYTAELGAQLGRAWLKVLHKAPFHDVYLGDWSTVTHEPDGKTNPYKTEWQTLQAQAERNQCKFLHFDSLLFHRRRTHDLMRFYRAVKNDDRQKLLIAPADMQIVAKNLGVKHLPTPMSGLAEWIREFDLTNWLISHPFGLVLFGAGMAINYPIVRAWEENPKATYVAIGSSLDPVCFGRKTRTHQLDPEEARAEFVQRLGAWQW
jgi:hypothetical protein